MTCEQPIESLPDRCDLAVVRGTDNSFEVTLTDGENPIDISAADVKLTVVSEPGESPPVFEQTNAAGSHSDPTNGRTVFSLSKATTELASQDLDSFWQFEIRRIEGGEEFVHIEGALTVKRGLGI